MDHYRPRKYRGPETWAQARACYVAGEPGPSVARRFDVGLSNLRKKARAEGWDRASLARAHDLKPIRGEPDPPAPSVGPLQRALGRDLGLTVVPGAGMTQAEAEAAIVAALGDPEEAPEPAEAARVALARAADDLAAGRIQRAQAGLRALQALARVADLKPPPPQVLWRAPDPEVVRQKADQLARILLSEDTAGVTTDHSAWVYHWRARHLGPEVAALDFARAVEGGWATRIWDAEGRLRPIPAPPAPSFRMAEQHARGCAWIDEHGEGEG